MGNIFAVFLIGVLYRIIFSQVLETKISLQRTRDIEDLLSRVQWCMATYMLPLIGCGNWGFKILFCLYYVNIFVLILSTIVYVLFVFDICPEIIFDEQYWRYATFMIINSYIAVPLLFRKPKVFDENRTFQYDVQRFEEAKQVWDSLTTWSSRRYKEKIWNQLRIRAVDLQQTVLDYCSNAAISVEEKEKAVSYAWNCLCEVENCSRYIGKFRYIREKSTIFVDIDNFTQEFETAYEKYLSGDVDVKKHYFESMFYTAKCFGRCIEKRHNNNLGIQRDDTHEVYKNCTVLFEMIQKINDTGYSCDVWKEEIFQSIYTLYHSLNNKAESNF